jgi:hypothetical protein
VPRPFRPLPATHVQLSEYASQHFTATLPPGVNFHDITLPEYWTNVTQLRPGAIIVVRDARLTEWAELLVRAIRPADLVHGVKAAAFVTILRHHSFEPLKLEVKGTGYQIRYLSPELLWCIVKMSDGQPVATNFQTRDAAREHLEITAATGPV